MKGIIILVVLAFSAGCRNNSVDTTKPDRLQSLATKYVRLGLAIGQYDADFVDAYYGPDSLKPGPLHATIFPKDSLINEVTSLQNEFKEFVSNIPADSVKMRVNWIISQLTAFKRRIKIYAGDYASFDEESKELYGAVAPVNDARHFQNLVSKLDSMLIGDSSIPVRFQRLANHFIIPKNKLDTVFKVAIAECRARTKAHYALPASETFTLEYVHDKPWSGYNWYKGNYKSIIQINTDLQIFIDRAIDVGSHESYPGHHVYNMLLEQNLYRQKGFPEISIYPLFSPQSLIAEGSANYGIELAFPGNEKTIFAKEVLLPLAGLDTSGITLYFQALEIKEQLNYARNEVARGLINNTMNEQDAIHWLIDYCLLNKETALKSISFIRKNRSYVINYNYGKDLVRQYIDQKESHGHDSLQRWQRFSRLLSNELTPDDLMNK